MWQENRYFYFPFHFLSFIYLQITYLCTYLLKESACFSKAMLIILAYQIEKYYQVPLWEGIIYPSSKSVQWEEDGVLLSAAIELIFFLLSGMVLHFVFRITIILTAHRWFSCCIAVLAQHWGFFRFLYCSASEELRVHKKLGGGTESGQQTQTSQRDIPCHLALHETIELGELARKGWGEGK